MNASKNIKYKIVKSSPINMNWYLTHKNNFNRIPK